MTKEILIVQDEGVLANLLNKNLSRQGHRIVVQDCAQILAYLVDHRPDVILIEVPPCKSDDFPAFCQAVRQISAAPLIVLTEVPLEIDDLDSIELLTKPLDFRELTDAIDQALNQQRRRRRRPPRFLRLGDLTLDLEKQILTRHKEQHHLRPKEFLLLKMFMSNPGQVLSHRVIMKEVWSTDYIGDTRTLYVHVSWIREKVEDDPHTPQRLRTVRGVGYRFEV